MCSNGQAKCQEKLKTLNNSLRKYITFDKPYRSQTVSSILKIPKSLDDYIYKMRKVHKGNAVREVIKAEKKGYIFDFFNIKNHTVDLVEINYSMKYRQGRKMSTAYHKSVEEYGGIPSKLFDIQKPICDLHYNKWIGVFLPDSNHMQGPINVKRRLVGYINLTRFGSIVIYGSILGHGEFLKDGIMYFLNQKIIDFLINHNKKNDINIEYILYAGWDDGGIGLQRWKKRNLFRPFYLKQLN